VTRGRAVGRAAARTVLVVIGAVALALAGGSSADATTSHPSPVSIDDRYGEPGFCADDTGVTVVVDFQQLGGDAIVRCFPDAQGHTGLDALKGAGFQIEGVQRWGEAFVCRIENRPSAVDPLAIDGDEDYRERCIDTPPAAGYWSYWQAGNNCGWSYSQWGLKNRAAAPGGFEGWSFSLNATADSGPKPRIAAVRPGTEGATCNADVESNPTTGDPDEQDSEPATNGVTDPDIGPDDQPEPNDDDPTRVNSAADESLPEPLPRERSTAPPVDDPADNVSFTDGEDAADVQEAVKEQAGASDVAPWVAVGAIVVLGALTFLTARRRRREGP